MGWVILVIVCIIILIVLLYSFHPKKAKKTEPQGITISIPDKHVEDNSLAVLDQSGKSTEDLKRGAHQQPRVHQPLTTLRPPTERHKSYTRYDRQKIFEDSIMSPFPEELGPASPYLYEANRLERAGADQVLVEQVLAKARELDAKATAFYLARWSVIKKRQKPNG